MRRHEGTVEGNNLPGARHKQKQWQKEKKENTKSSRAIGTCSRAGNAEAALLYGIEQWAVTASTRRLCSAESTAIFGFPLLIYSIEQMMGRLKTCSEKSLITEAVIARRWQLWVEHRFLEAAGRSLDPIKHAILFRVIHRYKDYADFCYL